MLNGWMNKAKHLAADLDQQLNDSVGMDPNGTASASTNTNTGATFVSDQNVVASMKTSMNDNTVVTNPSSTVVNLLNENDDDDAWNDDFDFGDDDDDVVVDVDIIDVVATKNISVSSTTSKKTTKPPKNRQRIEEQMLESSSIPDVSSASKTTKKVDTMSPLIPTQNKTITSAATTIPIRSVEDSRESATSIKLSTTTDNASDTPSKTATDIDNDDAMTTSISPIVPAAGSISIPKDGEGSGGGLFSLAQKMTTEVATGGVTSLFTTMKTTSKFGGEGKNTDDNEIKKHDTGDFAASTSTEVNGTPSVEKKHIIEWDEDATVIDDDSDKDDLNDGLNAISTKNVVLGMNSQSSTNMATNNTADNSANVATTPKTSGGGLFSNFSNLAQTADTLLVAAAAQLGGDDGDCEDEDVVILNKNKQDQQKHKELEEISYDCKSSDDDGGSNSASIDGSVPSIKLEKNKLLPSPMLSTPSYSVSAVDAPLESVVAEPNDLSINENNIIRKSTNDHRKSGRSEYEEEDVDGLLVLVEDNDSNKDTDDSVNERKAESKAIFSNQIPSPRQEEAILRNINTSVVENETSSSYSDVKLSLPSSTPKTEASPQQQRQQQQRSHHVEVKLQHNPPLEEDIPPTKETITTVPSITKTSAPIIIIEDDPHFKQLQETLRLREEQLVDKGGQLNELQSLLETRDQQYKQKLNDTKEEAKKRILRAKERCEVAEAKIQARSFDQAEDSSKQQLIIEELREEGQALAMKQSAMEQSVRAAKAETRSLTEALQQESYVKEGALGKIVELEKELKSVKESLNSAREGESQAGKLESDLLAARADAEAKNNTILINISRMKELTAESKELKSKIDTTRKSAAHEQQQEKTSMLREHSDLIGDLELKLRTTEREAGVREDALRHEVAEIRKRWQDAVRRADSLSMDMQSSTAPLLRQLESMERQSRLRTANAAELESRLRSELEEATIESETLGKNCSELKAKLTRLERSIKERNGELVVAREITEEQTENITNLKKQQEKLKSEAEKRQIEYEKVERLANEGVSRVRSEMTQTVIDSEERYRGQIDKMQKELKIEEEKRNQLEDQMGQLFETTGGVFASSQSPQFTGIRRESQPKKLHKAEGQAEILTSALGLGDDSDDNDTDDDGDSDDNDMDLDPSNRESFNSFAALEQLSSKLRSADIELKSMRKSLKESNETRQSMVEELGETRHAKEKLPLFEFKVQELSRENEEMEREIVGLKEDIADVGELYRTQLNVLLEEKVASSSSAVEIPPPSDNVNQDENNSSGVNR